MWVLGPGITPLLAASPPTGIYEHAQCLQCHQEKSPSVVANWQASAHAAESQIVACTICHGNTHTGSVSRARQDEACTECHGGAAAPVVHSYAASKHGLLLRLEQQTGDWSRPLQGANYRTPGCAYCHMYGGNHDVSRTVRRQLMDPAGRRTVEEIMRPVCQNCHSPRYVTRLFDNGEKMLELGRKKVREASRLLEAAEGQHSDTELAAGRAGLEKMQRHLKNVYLGIGHQSPDYQWWHGHPALDGDLLRIKGQLGELARRRAVAEHERLHKPGNSGKPE